MNSILLLHHHTGRVNGTLTSIIDLYFNLKFHGVKCDLKLICGDTIKQTIDLFKANSYFSDIMLLQYFTKDMSFEADVIIGSVKLLDDIKTYGIQIKCKRLVLIDSLDIVKSHYGVIPPLESPIKDTLLLCNPFTFELAHKSFKCLSYFHKFSRERMKVLPIYDHIDYKRENRDSSNIAGIHFENIGKIVLEHLYHEASIDYHGTDIKDGLYYYLKLLGIDGSKDHKQMKCDVGIMDKQIFMDPYDTILEII